MDFFLFFFIGIGLLLFLYFFDASSRESYDGDGIMSGGPNIIVQMITIAIFMIISFSVILPVLSSVTSGNVSDISQLSNDLLGDINWGLLSIACFSVVGIIIGYYLIKWLMKNVDVGEYIEKRGQERKERKKKQLKDSFNISFNKGRSDGMNISSGKVDGSVCKQPVVSGWKKKR